MVKLNGELRGDIDGRTVAEVIAECGFKTQYIAVELNGGILPKSEYASAALRDGDVIEIVNFVGGG